MISLLQKCASPGGNAAFSPTAGTPCHFPNATTEGSLLLCAVYAGTYGYIGGGLGTTVINTPVTPGLDWVLAATVNFSDIFSAVDDATESETIALYYCANAPSIGSGVETTVSLVGSYDESKSDYGASFIIAEFGGIAALDPLDSTETNTGSPGVVITAGNITVSSTDLIVVFGSYNGAVAGAGYTLLQSLTPNFG